MERLSEETGARGFAAWARRVHNELEKLTNQKRPYPYSTILIRQYIAEINQLTVNSQYKSVPSSPPPPKEKFVNKAKRIRDEMQALLQTKVDYPRSSAMIKVYEQLIEDQYRRRAELRFRLIEQAIKGWLNNYELSIPEDVYTPDPLKFLTEIRPRIAEILENELNQRQIVFQLVMKADFEKADDTEFSRNLNHARTILLHTEDVEAELDTAIGTILRKVEDFVEDGAYILKRVKALYINVTGYKPIKAGCHQQLPKHIRGVICPKNDDERCFMWAVLMGLYYHQLRQEGWDGAHAERIKRYEQFIGNLNLDGIKFPMSRNGIRKFEYQNNVQIFVYRYRTKQEGVHPYYISKGERKRVIDLFLHESDNKAHYSWIKSYDTMLHRQNKHEHHMYFCHYCCWSFITDQNRLDHEHYCRDFGGQWVKYPEAKDMEVKFTNYYKQLEVPFVIIADFESLVMPISACSSKPDYMEHTLLDGSIVVGKKKTEKTHLQEPCGYSYIVIRSDGEIFNSNLYRGRNVVRHLLNALASEERAIHQLLRNIVPMKLTPQQEEAFQQSETCHICKKSLWKCNKEGIPEIDRVRDHDHITGEFRGSAHNTCNLNYRITPNIPVVFHNLKGYDGHLIMKEIKQSDGELTAIAQNLEKYITFKLRHLKFIDSYQFMGASLQTLVASLAATGDPVQTFKITASEIPEDKLPLVLRKGVFCYSYMDSWEKFEEPCPPPKEAFRNDLNGEDISVEDYKHVQAICQAFKIRTLGEYHDFYLRVDVLQLADVWQNFRKVCMRHYGLDPSHYCTSPGLSWDALLKKTEIKLSLVTDPDMHLMIERGIRGGISMVSHRYSHANNSYLPDYDPSKPSTYIISKDANNLYGWAMMQSLPIGGFRWLSDDELKLITADTLQNMSPNDGKGLLFDVDLDYPSELHDKHNHYPLAPEKLRVKSNWLSPYTQTLQDNLGRSVEVQKLVPNLYNKEHYIVHYQTLQLYLSLGMKLKKIHRVIEFTQSNWMKPYIELNTELRQRKGISSFEKDFFKLMNNSVFGKTMENVRNRTKVVFIRGEAEIEKLRKLTSCPRFDSFKIFNSEFAAVLMKHSVVYLDKPKYVGQAVLDLSKTLMYDFYYNKMKRIYGDKVNLLYTDTDNLKLEVETQDIYQDMRQNPEWYDTSDYPKDHANYSETNKKVPGKMKDERLGVPMVEFIGLRPKMYSETDLNQCENKKAKGVNKSVTENQMKHFHYKKCLDESREWYAEMKQLRSDHHDIYTVSFTKLALSPMDTKRWYHNDGIHSYAYGHTKISDKMGGIEKK